MQERRVAEGICQRISEFRADGPLGHWRVASCQPAADLAPWVETLWFGEGRVSYQRDRILPNGGSFLLINLGPTQYLVGEAAEQRRRFDDIWFSASRQTPIDTEAPHGQALFGVAFRPHGATRFLHLPGIDTAEQVVPLQDLLGSEALSLRHRLLECQHDVERFAWVEQWLRRRLRGDTPASVSWALRRLQSSQGQVGIDELATELGISRKSLARQFQSHVGLSPKTLARLHRFQGALTWLGQCEQVPWVELATRCGYYDQSHLIRDFQAFSGYAPGEFVRLARPDANSVVVR
ncbi:helix-turn-helix domain-containing protein [Pseudomarimonas arenosa]|uniref:AraC family transcriptional regulator n=1 Tax=Pseudomarimonas arenosa TaxID=2774145 RepID=A0AAW3ZLE7_9GAMM|nr:helix-turn-helix domain-containing protein [Pseudomarimonas arenosa]MBD8526968.1 AraC family transcriptional regulator [Pseudomarimonas arenosa]